MPWATTEPASTGVPRGGLWEAQELYGGARLNDTFTSGERFILWGLKLIGEVPIPSTSSVADKTELACSRLDTPDDLLTLNTLSGPIAEMARTVAARPELEARDFPVIAYWHEVQTKRELNPAVVLQCVERYVGAS